MKLYYIEDDGAVSGFVREYLEDRGFSVEIFSTVQEARAACERRLPALALVDWNLPDGRGDGLLRWIRERWPELPVLFLTVRGDTRDVVEGFRYGADDYVVKPFELEVLYSRIQALLRRAKAGEEERIFCGELVLERERKAVCQAGREVALSPLEYRLLEILMENQGRTVTRACLLERLWDSEGSYVNDNTLTVTMKRLREKLGRPSCLKTVRSFGYRMEEER